MRKILEELQRHQRHLSNNAAVNISVILSGPAGVLATRSDGNAALFQDSLNFSFLYLKSNFG